MYCPLWRCRNWFWNLLAFIIRVIFTWTQCRTNNEILYNVGTRAFLWRVYLCVYVHTWTCIHRVNVKIIRADSLLFYCSRAAWPLLPSRWPSLSGQTQTRLLDTLFPLSASCSIWGATVSSIMWHQMDLYPGQFDAPELQSGVHQRKITSLFYLYFFFTMTIAQYRDHWW